MFIKQTIAKLLLLSILFSSATPTFAIFDKKNTNEILNAEIEKNVLKTINIDWWKNCNDEYLENYILKAVENNQDIKIATLRVEEARQNVKIQFASELPSLTGGIAPAVLTLPGKSSSDTYFAFPLIANYEIDLFLKNHDKTKSIKKLHDISKLTEKSTFISISSAVGATYYNIVRADKLIELQEEIIKDRKQIYELMKQRNSVGITSTSDMLKAEKAYVMAESDLVELKKAQVTLLSNLAVLIGDSPENYKDLKRISYDELKLNKAIPEKISSNIIFSRPDYLIAEKQLEKAGLDVKIAKKEFCPTFNITGLLAFTTSSSMSSLNWKNALAGVAGSGMLSLFTGGKKIANLKIQQNKYEQLLQNYQKTALTSVKEVNDSLMLLKLDDTKYQKNLKAYEMEVNDFKFSQEKYQQGIISYLDLLQKKETLLSLEKMKVTSDLDKQISQISLYKATSAANL